MGGLSGASQQLPAGGARGLTVEFRVAQPTPDFNPDNDRLSLHLWSGNESFDVGGLKASGAVVASPNDERPHWIAGGPPAGSTAKGNCVWRLEPLFGQWASHSSDKPTGRSLHGFQNIPDRLQFTGEECLIQYLYVDPVHPPQDIVLQLLHRGRARAWVYWGASLIDMPGRDKRRLGEMPPAGRWVRLKVPAQQISGEVDGIRFGHFGGQVYWGPTTTSLERLDPTPTVLEVGVGPQ